MQKTFKEYIEPVMSNMDNNTKSYLMYRFYSIYRLNPETMFYMTSKKTKETRITHFYYCVSQLYNTKCDARVIANAGQGDKFERLKSQSGQLPMPSVYHMRNILTGLSKCSTVSMNVSSPEIPKQTLLDWVKQVTKTRY